MTGTSQPLPGCPARAGTSLLSIDGAEFVYHAGDCGNNGNPVTEISGFFCRPGWQQSGDPHRDDDDMVHAATLEVPAGSPVSRLAHQAGTPAGIAAIGEEMRRVIGACPCAGPGGCAALDELNLLAAIEKAARPAGFPRRLTRGLWHG